MCLLKHDCWPTDNNITITVSPCWVIRYGQTRFHEIMSLRCVPDWMSNWATASLEWRHDGCDGVSNLRRRDRLLYCLYRRRSKKTSKLRATGLCEGNPLVTWWFLLTKGQWRGNVSIWWRHHAPHRNYIYARPVLWKHNGRDLSTAV